MLLRYLRGFLAGIIAAHAVAASLDHHARLFDTRQDSDVDTENVQSTFVSPGGSLAFAFSVPENDNLGYYFSLRMSKDVSWAAVGLGSDDMPGALYLMIYQNEDGNNVTFSPRVAYGHYEPYFFDEMRWEVLEGTGEEDDHFNFNARCLEHCRTWPARGEAVGGRVDVSSSQQRAIYGIGPEAGFHSDSEEASIKYHEEHGSFTIDMKRTRGATEAPSLADQSESEGTTLNGRTDGLSDVQSIVHAVLMSVAFFLLMPLGVVLVRIGKWAQYHKFNQAAVGVLAFTGFGLGVNISFKYRRSWNFDAHHQIIGYLLIAFIIGQFTLGFLHHRQHKKTQAPTRYAQYHRWLGRAVLFFGIVNAFFGFTLARNRNYGQIIAGILFFLAVTTMLFYLGRYFLDRKRGRLHGPGAAHGHANPPWRQDVQPSSAPGYPTFPVSQHDHGSPSQVGLQDVPPSPSPWRRNSGDSRMDDYALGAQPQRPKEFT